MVIDCVHHFQSHLLSSFVSSHQPMRKYSHQFHLTDEEVRLREVRLTV